MDIRKLVSLGVFLASLSFAQVAWAGELPYDQYDSSGNLSYDAHYLYSDHFEAAYWMKEWGIFDGYEDGTFGALNEINRAELAKVLVLSTGVSDDYVETYVANYDAVNGTADYFWDLDMNAWYVKYVRYAQIQGWVSGYDDGSYKPSYIVLVAEAMKMIMESQYGTPDAKYAGDNWYDVYFNVFLDTNMIYEIEYGYLYYSYDGEVGDLVGFDADLDSKMTRKDALELLYRVRVVLEDGDGELVAYDPLMTIEEYESIYGATVSEVQDGVLTIEDLYFGLDLQNVYIGDFDIEDLRIYIENPSGYKNGWHSVWYLLYPTLKPGNGSLFYHQNGEDDLDEEGDVKYNDIFYVDVKSANFSDNAVAEHSYYCSSFIQDSFVPVDLQTIYFALCENADLNSILTGESDLVSIGDSTMTMLGYYDFIYDKINNLSYYLETRDYNLSESGSDIYHDEVAMYLSDLNNAYKLWGESSSELDGLLDMIPEYADFAFEYSSFLDESAVSDFYDQSLAVTYAEENDYYMDFLADYEKQILSFNDTFTVDVLPDYLSGPYDGYYFYGLDSVVVNDDMIDVVGYADLLYHSLAVIADSELDIWDGTQSDNKWMRITLSGVPWSEDDYESDVYKQMSFCEFIDYYYYEILDIEWIEE